ncbi:MAG TPA: 1-(5-phosphoribosyl)-5-[(5-phosphoribosylamino)methylideneamino] imidazole-4-carboxamide isomerase [Candidatus Limnocylindrales bacterium]|jgi:phosphoribosylformimino-5-aminoimidazole carboxamide ribotide isomerase
MDDGPLGGFELQTAFELLPAIDIRAGRVVRLAQGDFERETTYETDPVAVAARFVALGATWLHVVDLDGAIEGEPLQLATAAEIVAETYGRARVELGGGLRTAVAVAGAIGTGAARVTVGTAALHDPAFVRSIVGRHGPERIVASIDIRDGVALGEGWRQGAPGIPAVEAIDMLAAAGVVTFEVTSIERDGLLEGPDLELLRGLVERQRGRIIASGGVASIEDVLAVQAIGCGGVIVGRALYEGRIEISAALAAIGGIDRRVV